jgi:hypothetical protein
MALASCVDDWRSNRSGGGTDGTSGPLDGVFDVRPGTLLGALLGYAKCTVESTSETSRPEEDVALLWTLTELATRGKTPTCKEVLEKAREADPEAMRGMSARRVSEILGRYGLKTVRCGGRNIFRDVLTQLKVVEVRYGTDLNSIGRRTVNVQTALY